MTARERGDFKRAQALGQRAPMKLEIAVGPDHPDVANVLHHLAPTCEEQSDSPKAERLYTRAVGIMEAITVKAPDLVRVRVQCW